MRILFICTGNTCRSSMAEALFKDITAQRGKGKKALEAFSAGLAAQAGEYASPNAILVMADYGIDLSCHTAAPLTETMLSEADLILTMTEAHKRLVLAAAPGVWQRIHTIREYALMPGSRDIQDPYGQPLEDYRQCAMELREALLLIIERLEG